MGANIMQLLTAFFGSLGFAMLFGLRKELLFVASLGGLCSWGIYLACLQGTESLFASCLIAASFAAFYAEVLARIKKAPTTLFLVPSVVPLIPGSCLYYTMSYAVQGMWEKSREYGSLTVQYALAIAAGISLVLAFSIMLARVKEIRGKEMD